MSDTQTDAQRDISHHLSPDNPTLSGESINLPIQSPHNSTDHRAIAFCFGPNIQGYSDAHDRDAHPPERPHMTTPYSHTIATTTANLPAQARTRPALDYSKRHRLPCGRAYNEPDQDDWSVGSDNPADFEPLAIQYTTFPSSIQPHVSSHPTQLSSTAHHTDEQLSVWLHQSHDRSRATYISLGQAILSSADLRTHCVYPTPDSNPHPRRHKAGTNLPFTTKTQPLNPPTPAKANNAKQWVDGPDSDPIHRRARRHVQLHGTVRAHRSRSVDRSRPFNRPVQHRRLLNADEDDTEHRRIMRTAHAISESYRSSVELVGPFV